MKTFKNLLAEVAQPRSADEKRFKAKHVIKKKDHPVAKETQFTADDMDKDHSKIASYSDGEDEAVYEEKKKQKTWRVSHSNLGVASVKAHTENQAISRGLSKLGVAKKFHSDASHRKNLKVTKEETEQLNELSPALLKRYRNKAYKSRDRLSDNSEKAYSKAWNSEKRGFSSGDRGDKKMEKKHADKAKQYYSQADKLKSKSQKRDKWIDKSYRKEEVFIEAVSPGNLRLKDNSQVRVSKEDAQAMNELFNNLSDNNRKRMESEMMKSGSDYDRILQFAREAQ